MTVGAITYPSHSILISVDLPYHTLPTKVASRKFRKGGQKWVLLNEGGVKLTF